MGTSPLYFAVRISSVRIVLQRVSSASVKVAGETIGEIETGLVLLVGIEDTDTAAEAEAVAEKVWGLRVFSDDDGRMNLSVSDVGGSTLVVSQFTLFGDVRRGRRPSFTAAGHPSHAERIIEALVDGLGRRGLHTETGRFGAKMDLVLVNDGPVTLVFDVRDGRVS